MLSNEPVPTVLYGVVPEDAASNGKSDTSFYFEEDGSLTTLVSGGGTYNHMLWDYGADSLVVSRMWPYPRVVTYAVERKQVGYSRQIILLAPIKIFDGFSAIIAHFLIDGKRLERFQPVVETPSSTFIRFKCHKRSGTSVCTGRPGQTISATIPLELDNAIEAVSRLSKTNILLPTVESWLGSGAKQAAALLTEYHREKTPAKMPTVFPVEVGVRGYSFEPRNYCQDNLPKLQSFMSPIVHGAFAPVADAAGERRCVEGRITSLSKKDPTFNSFVHQCMTEFVELVLDGQVLSPVCQDVVLEKQTGAAQLSLIHI